MPQRPTWVVGLVTLLAGLVGCQGTGRPWCRATRGPGVDGAVVTASTKCSTNNLPNDVEIVDLPGTTETAVAATAIAATAVAPASTIQLVSNTAPINSIAHHALEWTLADLEERVLSHHPGLREAQALVDKARGFRKQVGLKPNPVVGYNGSQIADEGTDQHSLFVEQDLVLGGKLRRGQRVLDLEIEAAQWACEVQRQRARADVRTLFYTALAAQRQAEFATDFEKVAAEGVRIGKLRLDAGEADRTEMLQAQIQGTQVAVRRQQAQVAYRAAWRRLALLAGCAELPDGQLIGALPTAPMPRDWAAEAQTLLEVSPEVQAAHARIRQAQADLCRHQAQPTPNVSVMVGGGVDNATDNGFLNTNIGMTLPTSNQNQGNIGAAQAEVLRATEALERLQLALKVRLAAVEGDYESAAVAVRRYHGEILPWARETLDVAEKAYAAGEYGFLQVLIARRTYFESALEMVAVQEKLAHAQVLLDTRLLQGSLEPAADTRHDATLRDQALNNQ